MAFTVTNLVDNARDLYNGTGDTFYTDARLYEWFTQAANIMARESGCIETTSTSSTVIATSDYTYPTNVIELKRLTYNGQKLQKISLREMDAMTLSGTISTTSGTPLFYTSFNNTVTLFPVPAAVGTLKWFTRSEHATFTSGTTILIPSQFQLCLVDYVLKNMYSKDKDFESALFYKNSWDAHVISALKYMKKKKRSDSFANVQVEELVPGTTVGAS